jgi:hypothetical protein
VAADRDTTTDRVALRPGELPFESPPPGPLRTELVPLARAVAVASVGVSSQDSALDIVRLVRAVVGRAPLPPVVLARRHTPTTIPPPQVVAGRRLLEAATAVYELPLWVHLRTGAIHLHRGEEDFLRVEVRALWDTKAHHSEGARLVAAGRPDAARRLEHWATCWQHAYVVVTWLDDDSDAAGVERLIGMTASLLLRRSAASSAVELVGRKL